MKKLKITLMFAIMLVASKKTMAQEPSKTNSFFQISPFAGVNLNKKFFMYGGELGYEYRINNRWSAIGNAMFSTGSTNKSQTSYAGSTSVLVDHQRVSEYGVSLGAKYYIGNFFVSGTVGYGRYDQTLRGKYDYPGIDPADRTYHEGRTTKYGVYQNYGIGYQIPLKNGNNLEIFMKGYHTRDWNMATGISYSFGLGKK